VDGVDDEADGVALDFYDDNACAIVEFWVHDSELVAQVEHGDDSSSKVDHALDPFGALGDLCEFEHPVDFLYAEDVHSEEFFAYGETDELKLVWCLAVC